MNWFKKKHHLIIGEGEDFNLGKLVAKEKFNVHINGSIGRSYRDLYNKSKSQNSNVAVVEERSVNSMKGALYSVPGNVFCSIKGRRNLDYTSNEYVLVRNF